MSRSEGADPPNLPSWLNPAVLARVIRVDLGLEGDWSRSVTPVWDPVAGPRPLPELPSGPGLRPCLELYLEGGWIGVHSFVDQDGVQVLDRARAGAVVQAVHAAVQGRGAAP